MKIHVVLLVWPGISTPWRFFLACRKISIVRVIFIYVRVFIYMDQRLVQFLSNKSQSHSMPIFPCPLNSVSHADTCTTVIVFPWNLVGLGALTAPGIVASKQQCILHNNTPSLCILLLLFRSRPKELSLRKKKKKIKQIMQFLWRPKVLLQVHTYDFH